MNKWYSNIDFLFEGRLEDVKKKYRDSIQETVVDYLSENDPSGNNKYLDWMVKRKIEGAKEKQIIWLVNKFNESYQSLKKKDIYQYRSIDDLYNALGDVGISGYSKDEKSERKKENTVYESKKFIILMPDRQSASCEYGSNTKWCISANGVGNAFDAYNSQNYRFAIAIDKTREKTDPLRKISLSVLEKQIVEIFNAENVLIAMKSNHKPLIDTPNKTNREPEEILRPFFGEEYDSCTLAIFNFVTQNSDWERWNPYTDNARLLQSFIEDGEMDDLVEFLSDIRNLEFIDIATMEELYKNISSWRAYHDERRPRVMKYLLRACRFKGIYSIYILRSIIEREPEDKFEVIKDDFTKTLNAFKDVLSEPDHVTFPMYLISAALRQPERLEYLQGFRFFGHLRRTENTILVPTSQVDTILSDGFNDVNRILGTNKKIIVFYDVITKKVDKIWPRNREYDRFLGSSIDDSTLLDKVEEFTRSMYLQESIRKRLMRNKKWIS